MRHRFITLSLLTLVLVAGCIGSPAGTSGNTTSTSTAAAGVAVPSTPDHPDRLTADSVAAYANGTETHRFYSDAVDDGATDTSVSCEANTVGLADGAGYALVECGGAVYHDDSVGSTHWTTLYQVTADGETRVDRVSTRDDGSDDDRRLRVYNFDDEERSLTVTVSQAGVTGANASTTYQYRVRPESGAMTTGLRLNSSVDSYDVTVAATDGSTLSTRWTTTGEPGAQDLTGVVIVTPDGEVVWGTAPA